MVSLSIKRQSSQRNHPVKAPKMGHLYTEAFGGHPLLLTFLRPIPCAGTSMAGGAAEGGHGDWWQFVSGVNKRPKKRSPWGAFPLTCDSI